MDGVVIGILAGCSVALAMLYWTLLVRPHLVVSTLFRREDDFAADEDGFGWQELDAGSLRTARWASGVVLVTVSFLFGATTTFLLAT